MAYTADRFIIGQEVNCIVLEEEERQEEDVRLKMKIQREKHKNPKNVLSAPLIDSRDATGTRRRSHSLARHRFRNEQERREQKSM